MNQMNQMNQMNPMDQMNPIYPMNPLDQLNPMYPMNQMNAMNQMNPMDQMNNNQIEQTNQIEQMNKSQTNPKTQINQGQINEKEQLDQNQSNLISLNIKNNKSLNPKNFWINLNKINLINSIIDFYQKNKKIYMNFNEKFQIMNLINNLNPDITKIQNETKILDPFHYIDGEKIIITFINHSFKIIKIKIPISINKMDLYSIAKSYKSNYLSKILLIHKDSIIEENEFPIKNFLIMI